jgi:hypothetical protein
MTHRRLIIVCAVAAAVAGSAAPAFAQAKDLPRWARVSFFAQGATTSPTDGGEASTFSELTTSLSAESARHANGGFEYGVNVRFSAYPSTSNRAQRVSVYDAYVAQGMVGGRVLLKAGQMWLTDLGGLGSVTGGLLEIRQVKKTPGLRWRAGAFGGLEPKYLEVGYAPDITKYGGYVALDGKGSEKHVLGYVMVRNQSLTERSVVTMTNFVPAGRSFFLYQAAEINVGGAGGQGKTNVGYFFVNANMSPSSRVDLQLTYHRGQSIDFRTITDDILRGRPVPAKSLDGFLFESVGGRLTLGLTRTLRVFGGYSQDKNSSSTDAVNRVSFGLSSSNLFKTGLDVHVSDYRYSGGTGPSYDSWYASVGRSITPRVYLSGEYTSSLSILRYVQSSGIVIENRPRTKRFGGTAIVHVGRMASVLVIFDHTQDDNYRENRVLAGLNFRF